MIPCLSEMPAIAYKQICRNIPSLQYGLEIDGYEYYHKWTSEESLVWEGPGIRLEMPSDLPFSTVVSKIRGSLLKQKEL